MSHLSTPSVPNRQSRHRQVPVPSSASLNPTAGTLDYDTNALCAIMSPVVESHLIGGSNGPRWEDVEEDRLYPVTYGPMMDLLRPLIQHFNKIPTYNREIGAPAWEISNNGADGDNKVVLASTPVDQLQPYQIFDFTFMQNFAKGPVNAAHFFGVQGMGPSGVQGFQRGMYMDKNRFDAMLFIPCERMSLRKLQALTEEEAEKVRVLVDVGLEGNWNDGLPGLGRKVGVVHVHGYGWLAGSGLGDNVSGGGDVVSTVLSLDCPYNSIRSPLERYGQEEQDENGNTVVFKRAEVICRGRLQSYEGELQVLMIPGQVTKEGSKVLDYFWEEFRTGAR